MRKDPDADAARPETDDPLDGLSSMRVRAPAGFSRRVMAALPERPDPARFSWLRARWPDGGRWLLPALAGALAVVLILGVVPGLRPAAPVQEQMTVHFELHAADARTVELVGSFTDWQTGRIRLKGPDSSGHWTADVDLPAGRHEYIFLVDGKSWTTDPRAELRRADGFGRENAVMDL